MGSEMCIRDSIVSVQNEYNLRNRTSEDVLAACERLGIAFLPWYPLGGKRGLRAQRIKEVASRRGLTHAALSLTGCSLNQRSCCQSRARDPSIIWRIMCLRPPSSLIRKTLTTWDEGTAMLTLSRCCRFTSWKRTSDLHIYEYTP